MARSQVALSEEQTSKWAWLDTDNDGQVSANDIAKVIFKRAKDSGYTKLKEAEVESAAQVVIDYFFSDIYRTTVPAVDFQNIDKYDDRADKSALPYYFQPEALLSIIIKETETVFKHNFNNKVVPTIDASTPNELKGKEDKKITSFRQGYRQFISKGDELLANLDKTIVGGAFFLKGLHPKLGELIDPAFEHYCNHLRGEKGPSYYPAAITLGAATEINKLLASHTLVQDATRTDDKPNSRKLNSLRVTIWNPIESVHPSGPVNLDITIPHNLFVSKATLVEIESSITKICENLLRRGSVTISAQEGLFNALDEDAKNAAQSTVKAEEVVAKYGDITEEELRILQERLANKPKAAPKSNDGQAR